MLFDIEKSFIKDFEKSKNPNLAKAIKEAIKKVEKATTIQDIAGVKKLKGFKNAYRIRVGNYRIGIVLKNDTAIFTAFAHRSNIYKIFP